MTHSVSGPLGRGNVFRDVRCSNGHAAEFVSGAVMYPHRPDLADHHIYRCVPCDERVGCHVGTARPKGTMAGSRLRRARAAAHEAFDPLWREGAFKNRRAAYTWLAQQLGISFGDCHIGNFDEEYCQRVVEIATEGGFAL